MTQEKGSSYVLWLDLFLGAFKVLIHYETDYLTTRVTERTHTHRHLSHIIFFLLLPVTGVCGRFKFLRQRLEALVGK